MPAKGHPVTPECRVVVYHHRHSIQAAVTFELHEDLELGTALGYYHHSNPTPDGDITLLSDNAGNALVDRSGDGNMAISSRILALSTQSSP